MAKTSWRPFADRMRQASGQTDMKISEDKILQTRLAIFLYDLMQEHLPMGTVQKLVMQNEDSGTGQILYKAPNGWLAQSAMFFAQVLLGPYQAAASKPATAEKEDKRPSIQQWNTLMGVFAQLRDLNGSYLEANARYAKDKTNKTLAAESRTAWAKLVRGIEEFLNAEPITVGGDLQTAIDEYAFAFEVFETGGRKEQDKTVLKLAHDRLMALATDLTEPAPAADGGPATGFLPEPAKGSDKGSRAEKTKLETVPAGA